jgi:hypothetical protein
VNKDPLPIEQMLSDVGRLEKRIYGAYIIDSAVADVCCHSKVLASEVKRLWGQPAEAMQVVLFQELPSQEWVVDLQKMGYRFTVYRSAPGVRHTADAMANGLAQFLGIPRRDV